MVITGWPAIKKLVAYLACAAGGGA